MRFIALIITLGLAPLASAQDYTLDAPSQAHIRQAIEVNWTAPQDTGGMLEIRPTEEGARRAAYAYVRNNPERIEVPEAPGDYVLVYVFEGAVHASRPLTVIMAEATVSGPDSVGAGETFEVSWTGPASRSDSITWAERNGAYIRGTSYGYVQDNTEGSRSLRAPADAGEYDLIYRSGETILARHPISVGTISASVEAPAQIHAGGRIPVTFDGPDNNGDLITFADRDGDVRRGIGSYTYVTNATDNAVTLRVGETLGDFDVVYVSNNRVIGRSPITIVEASVDIDGPGEAWARSPFTVAWEGAGNAGDMIFIADVDGNEYDYSYVDPNEPAVELVAPEVLGGYDLVYRTRGGQEMDREALTVIPAPNPPGELIVTQGRAALGEGDAVEIILDASGSMLQRIGGDRRIEIAKATLTELVTDTIPEGTGFALRVFGHREADSCRTDLEIPLGPLDAGAVTSTIAGVNAMNLARTPIGASIGHVRSDLADVPGQRVLVVLTDGEETCDGDAEVQIQALRELGWDIRVNIVGFAIDDADLARTFESWAAAGGGEYFSAADADGLAEAMTRAVATRFEVVDEDGETVASGLTGGDPVVLAPGDYRVVTAGGEVAATIISEEVTTVGFFED
ncbi:vWA domain-containing protein [Hyphobacterium marinum]|uniref:VWA domain-containing protein n=1 Tax=Hyphobacterium marinum TaxID=3116574 RepID=A0ABU7M1B2_9PROT|nr:VWA domain-containing protein [Hyphobacterium sp. Y6023]MEE2567604.1 VWA domain-containing protein [Hyphobacterium sp. Y6023]